MSGPAIARWVQVESSVVAALIIAAVSLAASFGVLINNWFRGRREDSWLRVDKAIDLVVSESERANLAGYTMLNFIEKRNEQRFGKVLNKSDRAMLAELAEALLNEEVPDSNYLAHTQGSREEDS